MIRRLLDSFSISLICSFCFCNVSATMHQDGFSVNVKNKLTETVTVVAPKDSENVKGAALQELTDPGEFNFININADSEHYVSAIINYVVPSDDRELTRFPIIIASHKQIGEIVLSYSVECSRMVVSFQSSDPNYEVSLYGTKRGGGGIGILIRKK